eukprot:TRINITY_DN14217_c0_g1_i1.p3 TRINITY_DN14217_c0_g1~~TRINITY_DN14217_c0_g1_i1.p3  ORF type:complete len:109 (+),score=27.11 TRINITY_DN14217_c0_g1_i1:375-701(+)
MELLKEVVSLGVIVADLVKIGDAVQEEEGDNVTDALKVELTVEDREIVVVTDSDCEAAADGVWEGVSVGEPLVEMIAVTEEDRVLVGEGVEVEVAEPVNEGDAEGFEV